MLNINLVNSNDFKKYLRCRYPRTLSNDLCNDCFVFLKGQTDKGFCVTEHVIFPRVLTLEFFLVWNIFTRTYRPVVLFKLIRQKQTRINVNFVISNYRLNIEILSGYP